MRALLVLTLLALPFLPTAARAATSGDMPSTIRRPKRTARPLKRAVKRLPAEVAIDPSTGLAVLKVGPGPRHTAAEYAEMAKNSL